MTRTLYAGRIGDTVASLYQAGDGKGRVFLAVPADAQGYPTPVVFTVWDDPDGTQLEDLLAADGTTPITTVTVPASDIQIPGFYGPDGVTSDVWLKDPAGVYFRMDASPDVSAAAATAAADRAEAAVALVPAMWQPSTAYTAGSVKVAPDGSTISRIADGTSRATFDPTEQALWEPVISKAGTIDKTALDASIVDTAGLLGANIPRTLAKLRNGENITIGVIGDSKEDPGTPGNVGGTAVARLATSLQTRFGVTVTVVNVAESGDTAAVPFLGGGVATLVAAAPDLTFVNLGTNDSNSDTSGSYAAGYIKEASWAAVERACAYLRDAKESAEFFFIGTTPYTPASSSNPKIVTYNNGIRALAGVVGAEYHSLYDTWWNDATFQSSPTTYLYDSTHPNGVGNAFSAVALLTHFPLAAPKGVRPALAPRAVSGKYGVNRVNKALGALGYVILSTAGSGSGCTLALTGTWTLDGNYDVTTTVNDYFTLSGTTVREFLANIDLGSASIGSAYPVVDIYLDAVLVAANVNLHTQSGKDSTAYWLAPFTGLDGAAHSMKVVLKSGMLRVGSYAVLVGGASTYTPETRVEQLVAYTATTTTLTTTTTATVATATLNLPTGWVSMDVYLSGEVRYRNLNPTTADRTMTIRPLFNGNDLTGQIPIPIVQQAATRTHAPARFTGSIKGVTGNRSFAIRAFVDNATDTIQTIAAGCDAILVRTG